MALAVVGSGGATTSASPCAATSSASPSSGNCILLGVHQDPNSSGVYGTLTPPTGFALVTSATVQKSDWGKLSVYSKVSDGTEGTNYSVSSSAAMDGMSVGVLIISGSDASTPTPGTAATLSDTSSNTTWSIPDYTTANDNSWTVAFLGHGGNTSNAATAILSSFTNSYSEDVDVARTTASHNWTSLGIAHRLQTTAGAVGTAQATSATSDTSLAIVIEVKEAAAGGAITGTVGLSITPTGTLTGAGALAGSVALSLTPTGALTGAGALVGSAALSITPTGTLTGAGALAGAVALSVAPSGTLTGAGALAGSVPLALSVTGTLADDNAGAIAGSIGLTLAATGALTGAGALAGTVPLTITPTGVLTGAGALAGSVGVALDVDGTLTGTAAGDMAGSITISFGVTGALIGAGALVGSIDLGLGVTGTFVPVQSEFSGGFYFAFERETERRRRERRKREEAEEETQQLQDDIDREIATLLHQQEAEDAEAQELNRLKAMVAQFADKAAEEAMTERVRTAFVRANAKQNIASYLALEKELNRAMEEEEFMILMVLAN
jgi:hypothetical protein